MEVIAFVAVATGYIAFLTHHLLITRHKNFLHRLCDGLGPASFQMESHPGNQLWRKRTYTYQGTYQKRQLTIRYTFQPGFRGPSIHVNALEIQLPVIQKFWLRLLTDYRGTPPQEEIQIGIEPLDQHFIIHSNQPEAAGTFLQDEHVIAQLEILQSFFTKLEIHRGTLKLVYTEPVIRELTRIDLEIILDALMRLILFYESRSDSFKIVPVPISSVCPYCREKLDTQTERIVACAHCNTHLHQSCWEQNGQCTTWGCKSPIAHKL